MPGTMLAGEKRGLLDFREDVLRVAVQLEIADLGEREIGFSARPSSDRKG